MSEKYFMNNQSTLTTTISEKANHDTNNQLNMKNEMINENENYNLVNAETKSSNSLKPPSLSKAYRRRSKTYSGEEFSAHLEHFNQLSSSNEEHNKRTDSSNNDLSCDKRNGDELKINKYTINKEHESAGSHKINTSNSNHEHFSNNGIKNIRISNLNSSCKNGQFQSANNNLNHSSKKCVFFQSFDSNPINSFSSRLFSILIS